MDRFDAVWVIILDSFSVPFLNSFRYCYYYCGFLLEDLPLDTAMPEIVVVDVNNVGNLSMH